MIKAKLKENAGLTLVEVLIAAVTFALVAVPLLGVFSYSLKMERRSLIHALETYTAQMIMEEAYGKTASELLTDYNDSGALDDFPDETVLLHYEYTASAWPDPADPDYDDLNLYKVTIKIWNEVYDVETTLEDIFYAEP